MESIFTNWSSWLLPIIAVVAIVCQSRAMAKQLKLQNYIEYTKRYQEIVLNFPENVNEKNFKMSELDDCVRDKTMRYMRAYYDLCFEEFDLKSKNFIDKGMWDTWEKGMKFAFSKSAFQQAWKKIKSGTQYGANFNKFVDDCNENANNDI